MIIAYPIHGNFWRLQSNSNAQEIFDKKEEIKKFGGKWNGKFWSVQESALSSLGAEKMVFVSYEEYCHTKKGTQWVPESTFRKGAIENPFCSQCSSRFNGHVKIEPVKN